MSVSVNIAASARVSVSVAPLIAGDPARSTLPSVPPFGVLFTANAPFARLSAAPRGSSNVIVSAVPVTDALATVGRTPSTLCPALRRERRVGRAPPRCRPRPRWRRR